MCTVRLRHKNKFARCRFFVVPGDDPAFLRMPDIELLSILKITCEIMGDQPADRKFDLQTIEPCNGSICKTNTSQQIKINKVDGVDTNSNIHDYFRFSTNKAADKKQAIHNEVSDVFCRNWVF